MLRNCRDPKPTQFRNGLSQNGYGVSVGMSACLYWCAPVRATPREALARSRPLADRTTSHMDGHHHPPQASYQDSAVAAPHVACTGAGPQPTTMPAARALSSATVASLGTPRSVSPVSGCLPLHSLLTRAGRTHQPLRVHPRRTRLWALQHHRDAFLADILPGRGRRL